MVSFLCSLRTMDLEASVLEPHVRFSIQERIAFEVRNFPKEFDALRDEGNCVLLIWKNTEDIFMPTEKAEKIIIGPFEIMGPRFGFRNIDSLADGILFVVASERGSADTLQKMKVNVVGAILVTQKMYESVRTAAVTKRDAQKAAQELKTKTLNDAEEENRFETRAALNEDGTVDKEQTRKNVIIGVRRHLTSLMDKETCEDRKKACLALIQNLEGDECCEVVQALTAQLMQHPSNQIRCGGWKNESEDEDEN